MKVVYIKNLSINQKAKENCPLLGYHAVSSGKKERKKIDAFELWTWKRIL
jgi:hypothetical protein